MQDELGFSSCGGVPTGGGDAIEEKPYMTDWGEVLSMLGVMTAILGGIQWMVTRLMIEPLLKKAVEELKQWVSNSCPSKEQFQAHCQIDEERMESVHRDTEAIRRDVEHLRHANGGNLK